MTARNEMKILTQAELKAIAESVANTSDGPWTTGSRYPANVVGYDDETVAICEFDADAVFIASTKQVVPRLLSHIAALTTPPPSEVAPGEVERVAMATELLRLFDAGLAAQNEFSVEVAKNGIKVRQETLGGMLVKRKKAFCDHVAQIAAALAPVAPGGDEAAVARGRQQLEWMLDLIGDGEATDHDIAKRLVDHERDIRAAVAAVSLTQPDEAKIGKVETMAEAWAKAEKELAKASGSPIPALIAAEKKAEEAAAAFRAALRAISPAGGR